MKKLLSIILLICTVLCFPSCAEDKATDKIGSYTSYTSDTAVCLCDHPYDHFEWGSFVDLGDAPDSSVKCVFFDGKLYFCNGQTSAGTEKSPPLYAFHTTYGVSTSNGDILYFSIETDEFVGITRADYTERELKIQEKGKSVSKEDALKKAKKIAKKHFADVGSYDVTHSEKSDNSGLYVREFVFTKKYLDYNTTENIRITIAPSGECVSAFAFSAGISEKLNSEISSEKLKNSIEQKIQDFYNQSKEAYELCLISYQLGEQYVTISDGYIGVLTNHSAKFEISSQGSPFEEDETDGENYIFTVIEYIGE